MIALPVGGTSAGEAQSGDRRRTLTNGEGAKVTVGGRGLPTTPPSWKQLHFSGKFYFDGNDVERGGSDRLSLHDPRCGHERR